MKKITQTIRIGASSWVYWAAAKFAQKNGKSEITTMVQKLFAEHSTDADAQKFIKDALSGMPNAIVPFARDPIDIYATALTVKDNRDDDIVFFDEITQIEAGYFKFVNQGITYIDTVQAPNQFFESFGLDTVAHTLEALEVLDERPPQLTMYEDGDSDLQVLTAGASVLSSTDYSAEATLYIFDFEKIRKHRISLESCNMGRFPTLFGPEGFTLKINKPEKLLELHAASLQGYWALIQIYETKFICPLPDFTEDRQAKVGWLYPGDLLQRLTPRTGQVLTVELPEAVKLYGNHRWFGCSTVDQWLEVIALSEQSSK